MGRRTIVVGAVAAALVVLGCAKGETVATQTTSAPSTAPAGTEAPSEVCVLLDGLGEGADNAEQMERLEAVRDASPEEVRAAWDVVIAPIELLVAVDPSDPEYLEKFMRFTEMGKDPAYLEAVRTVDAFAEDECGIELGLGLPPMGPGSTGAPGSSSGSAPGSVAGPG